MSHQSEPRTVKSVQTTLDIIELLRERNGAHITEIADELGFSKGTIHSHLATLLENEYLIKDGDRYRLSLRYLELGEEVKERLDIYESARDEVDELATKTGEVAQFATEEHGKVVYVYKSRGENGVQTASSVGQRKYMHCISLGKAMLAHMTEQRVNNIIDRHGLPAFTDHTITSREALFSELESVREQGYAFDREELIDGLRCVAAPIVTDDEVLGAVSISGPANRMEGDRFEQKLPNLAMRSANVIKINTQFS